MKKNILKNAGVLLIINVMFLSTIVIGVNVNIKQSFNVSETISFSSEPLLDEDFSGSSFPPEGWQTDFWMQSNTSEAGGTPPEARVYKYDQYSGGQFYDNYIMTPAIDASSYEKIILEFKFAADALYPQYCDFYVKYRVDSDSSWVDITPWPNPLQGNISGTYTVSINCGPEGCGNAFQINWSFIGYYYYFNYFWLDDIIIEKDKSIPDQICSMALEYQWISSEGAWQEFRPSAEKLTSVSLPITQDCPSCDMLWLNITWNGFLLTQMTKNAYEFPEYSEQPWNWKWTEFNIDDIDVTPGEIYRIELGFDGEGEYFWAGYENYSQFPEGPYPFGESSVNPFWDFCFITWGYNFVNNPPDTKFKGPTEGATTIPYTFHIKATDPENDDVYFRFDWGDGVWTSWDGPFPHLIWREYIYTWTTHGHKTIRYQAKDIHDNVANPKEHLIRIEDIEDLTQDPYIDVFIYFDPIKLEVRDLIQPDKDELYSGNTVEYSILVWNNGNKDANNVEVDFKLLDFSIPQTMVDVPAQGCKMATTTWTIPYLDQNQREIIKQSTLDIKIYHGDDVDITPHNQVFSSLNIEIVPIEPPYHIIHEVFVYNENSYYLDVIVDLELIESECLDWEVYVDRIQFTIEPNSIEWINLIMIPPPDVKLGEKCEAVVSIYEVMKDTKGGNLFIRSECVRGINDRSPPTVQIDKPKDGFFILNSKLLPFPFTIIIGSITIESQVHDSIGEINFVRFFINDKCVYTCKEDFSYHWDKRYILKFASVNVIAYDEAYNTENDEVSVIKIL
jgi:hypothetical protein